MAITVSFLGQDITPYVTSWGTIEQVKDVLLAEAQFLTSQMSIDVNNYDRFLSPQDPTSTAAGVSWYNQALDIRVDGRLVYSGLVKNIQVQPTERVATIVSENALTKPSEVLVVDEAQGVDPADAMLSLLLDAGLGDFVDQASFVSAAGPSREAGATIDYKFDDGSNTTLLGAVQDIGSLASISVYVTESRIVARTFQPYQGGGAGLRFPVTDAFVRQWKQFEWDTESFNNRVTVPYPDPGDPDESLFYEDQDDASIRRNSVTRTFEFEESKVKAHDAASAAYFARTYLGRASNRRALLDVVGGDEFRLSTLGDRHAVSSRELGLDGFPMEIIEIHRSLDSDEVELKLAGLAETNEDGCSPLYFEDWERFSSGTQVSYLPGWYQYDATGASGSATVEFSQLFDGQVLELLPSSGGVAYL